MLRRFSAFLVVFCLAAALAAPAEAQFSLLPGASAQDQADGGSAEDAPADGEAQLAPETARALAEALQDPATRQALIDELLRAAEATGAAGDAATPEEALEGPLVSEGAPTLARQIAQFTTGLAEQALEVGERILRALTSLSAIVDGDRELDWDTLGETLINLAIVAGATFLAWWVVGRGARYVFEAAARRAAGRSFVGRLFLLLGTGLIDALVIALAWGGGYGLALALGETGQAGITIGLFLNAFLLIEMVKLLLRLLLAPRHGQLRLMPVGDATAGYWYFWFARLTGLLGYGMMLVVPAVNANVSFAVGGGLKVMIALGAAVLAIVLILANRRHVRQGLKATAARMRGEIAGRALIALAKIWHVLALIYVVALFVIWLSRPFDAMSFMLVATGESILAVVLGVLFVSLLTRVISGGIKLPENLRLTLPLLEARLNSFVPNVLKVVRLLVLLAVVLSIAQSWGILPVGAWLSSDFGSEAIGRLIAATAILAVAMLLWVAMSSWVEYRLNPDVGRVPTARLRTLLALFRNAFTVTLLLVAVMLALSELGVNIGPLLAGAGVVGLAVGFGAQKLVQDIITGAFIQFENALNEGDVVTLAGISGVVEKLTIRSVALRDLSGIYHLIPFSSVDSVSNFMKGFSYHLAEIGVAYREDVAEVKRLMLVAFDELKADPDFGPDILEPFEMHGVTQFADSAVIVRGRIKTNPGKQWGIGRQYNEIVKRIFDEQGVEIPFPHVTLWMGQAKDGSAPPMHVQPDQVEALTGRTQAAGAGGATAAALPQAARRDEDAAAQEPDAEEPSEESKQDGPN